MTVGNSFLSTPANPDPAGDLLSQARFVLVEPSHVGNIGSTARAVRAMGFTQLVVVNPVDSQFRTAPDAVALAAGAGDLLAQVQVASSLADALDGVHLAFATTGYARGFGPPPLEVRTASHRAACLAHDQAARVAFVFGPERTGLANEHVQACHHICTIPTDPNRGSLNLSQAVQIVAYELRREMQAVQGREDTPLPRRDLQQSAARDDELPASVEQTEALYAHLEAALVAVGYLDPAQPRHLMARVRRLLGRARPSLPEVDILRGVAAAMIRPRRDRAGSKKGSAG
jgi:tRNA/rRNA methyltransferase